MGVSVIGKGDNCMSWIHRDDVVGMALMALDNEEIRGPINVTSPYFATARELSATAGSVLGRPTFRVPEAVVRAGLGDAVDMITGSKRVFPRRAIDLEYEYHHARLMPALEASLMAE
jgi:hypothetical protein